MVGILLKELAELAHPLSGAIYGNRPAFSPKINGSGFSLHENASLALFIAGDFGFLTLIQSPDGPARYRLSRRFDRAHAGAYWQWRFPASEMVRNVMVAGAKITAPGPAGMPVRFGS